MKLFRKSFTVFFLLTTCLNNKIALASLILIIAALFSAFRGTGVKENESNASATLVSAKATANETKIEKSRLGCDKVEPKATSVIFQSTDGGRTWQDISQGLPENDQPEDFFAGESALYLRVKNEMYRSRTNLKTPVWEKETALDPRCTSIAFTRSGVMAYSYEGQIYQKMPSSRTWLPTYTTFKKHLVRTIFETSDGTVFVGCDFGLYRSSDRGESWKHVTDGWVMDLVESEGVLVGTSQSGIIRSADNGEHWETVISEGGVGIDVERIDGGFAAISYNSSTLSRRINISFDRGKTWKTIDEGLVPSLSISSIKQVGGYLICGHPNGIFRSSDMGKTWDLVRSNVDNALNIYGKPWMSVPSMNNGKAFTIYVSGNVLYAVARNAGC